MEYIYPKMLQFAAYEQFVLVIFRVGCSAAWIRSIQKKLMHGLNPIRGLASSGLFFFSSRVGSGKY